LRNSTDATPILPLLLNTRPFAGRHLLEFHDLALAGDQVPVNAGLRFSMKAVRPSL
jgi:hypothetical protein